ncbi:MAG: DUF1439 domain-containing protein, partial [Deltaproteobacteria bacterium]|nr:DUF1439 domain-containing protein [Deltaproteobacteria bacterium]
GLWAGLWTTAILVFGCSNPEIDVTMSQAEIQQKVAPKFPLQKKVLIADVTLHSPKVYFTDDRVGMKVSIDAIFLKYPLKGAADVQGKLRYVAQSGEFFVDEVDIVSLDAGNASLVNTDQLKKVIGPIVSNALQTTPVYTLPDDTLRAQLVGKLLKRVTVQGGSLIATFGK